MFPNPHLVPLDGPEDWRSALLVWLDTLVTYLAKRLSDDRAVFLEQVALVSHISGMRRGVAIATACGTTRSTLLAFAAEAHEITAQALDLFAPPTASVAATSVQRDSACA